MAREFKTDMLIIGGGTGGVAAALAAASLGKNVILTEETDWIGGQLTSQAVPPDENVRAAREQAGRHRALPRVPRRASATTTAATIRSPTPRRTIRSSIPAAAASRRCATSSAIGVAVLEEMLAPHRTSGPRARADAVQADRRRRRRRSRPQRHRSQPARPSRRHDLRRRTCSTRRSSAICCR